jgi:hypothetical protein
MRQPSLSGLVLGRSLHGDDRRWWYRTGSAVEPLAVEWRNRGIDESDAWLDEHGSDFLRCLLWGIVQSVVSDDNKQLQL